jgi:hypothetical protein
MVSSFDSFNLLFKNPVNPVILSKNKTKDAVETAAFPKTINYSADILQIIQLKKFLQKINPLNDNKEKN